MVHFKTITSSLATLVLAISALSGTTTANPSSTVNVWLRSNWDAPPLAIEILESAALEDPSIYFPLLDLLTSHLPLYSDLSPRNQLETITDLISQSNLPVDHPKWDYSSFSTSLGMHESTPKIQAYYQYYQTVVEPGLSTSERECESWVEWRQKTFCEVDALKRDIELTLSSNDSGLGTPQKLLPFDHIYPHNTRSQSSAILYISTLSSSQADLYEYLTSHAANEESFSIIVRYRPSSLSRKEEGSGVSTQHTRSRKNSLKGYGVELVLKRTDYLAVDDRDVGVVNDHQAQEPYHAPGSSESNVTNERYLGVIGRGSWEELVEKPLKLGEIADLGLKTASLIMSDPNPLEALIGISQDFPKHSASIARKVISDDSLGREVALLQRQVNNLKNSVWVNGRVLAEKDMNAFSLLSIMREERRRMLSLTSLGLTPEQAFNLLTDDDIITAMTEPDPMEGLVDASDKIEGGGVITWWNNIEKDKRYATWSNSVAALARPGRQGPFQQVRRNFWHVVLVMDMSKGFSLSTIAQTAQQMIKRGIPFRIGLVPMINDNENDNSIKFARLLAYMISKNGRAEAMEFMQTLWRASPRGDVDLSIAASLFSSVEGDDSFGDIISGKVATLPVDKVRSWLKRMSITPENNPRGAVFLNGQYQPLDERWTDRIMQDYMNQLNYIMQPGVGSELKAAPRVDRFFYDLPTTSARRNIHGRTNEAIGAQTIVNVHEIFPVDSVMFEQFVYSDSSQTDVMTTTFVMGDLDSGSGRLLTRRALEFMQNNGQYTRLGFIHIPSEQSARAEGPRLSTFIYQALTTQTLSIMTPRDLLSVLDELDDASDEGNVQMGKIMEEIAARSPGGRPLDLNDLFAAPSALTLAGSRGFWSARAAEARSIPVEETSMHILVNGRVFGPIPPNEFFAEDFATLARSDVKSRGVPILNALKTIYKDVNTLQTTTLSNLIMDIAAILGQAYSNDNALPMQSATLGRTRGYQEIVGKRSSFSFDVVDTALIRVFAVIDPISEQAQKWSSLLQMASEIDHVSLTVQLNPALALTEIPVKRFYRYETVTGMRFNADGDEALTGASFRDLPQDPILTLGMDVPTSWLVRPKESVHDLDNLQLDSILNKQDSSVVDIRFELEQLVIEGHGTEIKGSVPRGLQLQLATPEGESVADTSVMANLGYFQFKANPGLYQLQIRDGRGRDVYGLKGMLSDQAAKTGAGSSELWLASFTGLTIMPAFERQPGMELADVLEEVEPVPSLFNKIYTSLSTVLGRKPAVKRSHADINIFTVASGKLYERFASIMVLSVLKHTNSSVKFWFIENFLSPSFLEFLPHFAAEYGFEYELVTYRWPSWLRGQKEKQREIWGYKILFLDVLFPLSLDKVIFVDADQIVRTDLKELVDLDLQNRVYGYAPMGDDKPEMEGFRFWKTGYWKDALRGKPYHISALYVVDLKRFRQVAAGDRLRASYQALSADPGSLANLDQDLPNSMQDQLPIFTLDRSWLWCETWCSQDSLKDAKTIDLCQNPLTKQPKLERAKQIPEWDSYDQEVDRFAKRLVQREQDVHVATGSAEALEAEPLARTDDDVEGQEVQGGQRIVDDL